MSMLGTSKWLNCFQYCSKAFGVLGHLMVMMVLGLVLLSWYAVVFATYGPYLLSGSSLQAVGAGLVCCIFTALLVLLCWCYLAAVATDPGKVPAGWHPFLDEHRRLCLYAMQQARLELERMQFADYSFDRRDPRRPRWCKRCQCWKPERAHHCSVLGRCVLKMGAPIAS
ncbi:hypothetical protein QJQ45_027741 [Haematococcus lacustris]|nr:hypothetical protein QJQ45_027741 [Haematococcus lacustris]